MVKIFSSVYFICNNDNASCRLRGEDKDGVFCIVRDSCRCRKEEERVRFILFPKLSKAET